MMPIGSVSVLGAYLRKKRQRLRKIERRIEKNSIISKLFKDHGWFEQVEKQLAIWDGDLERYISDRPITIPEYELFRYLEDERFLEKFIAYFRLLEDLLCSDRTKYRKWSETKTRFFSSQVSQIYSAIFELCVLGELISQPLRVDPYYENIDGRVDIDGRYIYFEIKSLQKSRHDLEGVGAGGTQHDERQILNALSEKAKQLGPYSGNPCILFLSLYLSADITTSEWFTSDFFLTSEGRLISAVVISVWFTAGEGKKIIVNNNAADSLSENELAYLNKLGRHGCHKRLCRYLSQLCHKLICAGLLV